MEQSFDTPGQVMLAIQLGAGDAFVCAGVESMSRVPMLGFNPMPNPGLVDRYPQAYIAMGVTAENLARNTARAVAALAGRFAKTRGKRRHRIRAAASRSDRRGR